MADENPNFRPTPRSGKIPALLIASILVLGLFIWFSRNYQASNTPVNGTQLATSQSDNVEIRLSDVQMTTNPASTGVQNVEVFGRITNGSSHEIYSLGMSGVFNDQQGRPVTSQTVGVVTGKVDKGIADMKALSDDPLKPGETRQFRARFSQVAADWNKQMPGIRVDDSTIISEQNKDKAQTDAQRHPQDAQPGQPGAPNDQANDSVAGQNAKPNKK